MVILCEGSIQLLPSRVPLPILVSFHYPTSLDLRHAWLPFQQLFRDGFLLHAQSFFQPFRPTIPLIIFGHTVLQDHDMSLFSYIVIPLQEKILRRTGLRYSECVLVPDVVDDILPLHHHLPTHLRCVLKQGLIGVKADWLFN